jgi:hypothetical protein
MCFMLSLWNGDAASHVGIFDPSCELAPLYRLTGSPTPLPCVNKYVYYVFIQCVTGGGGEGIGLCGEHIQELYTVLFDQIPNLPIVFTTPNKNIGVEGPQTDKHMPPSPFTGELLRKAYI